MVMRRNCRIYDYSHCLASSVCGCECGCRPGDTFTVCIKSLSLHVQASSVVEIPLRSMDTDKQVNILREGFLVKRVRQISLSCSLAHKT